MKNEANVAQHVIGAILSVLMFWGLSYWNIPTLSWDFSAVYFLLAICTVPYWLITLNTVGGVITGGLLVLFFVIRFLVTSPILHHEAYLQLLGKESASDFSQTLPPIDISQAPLVSSDMALQAMQKRMSEVASIGSQVTVGTPVKQLVQGKLVWVAFMEHRGFTKWWSDGATPGYLTVSAHDPSDVKVVMELHGKPMKLRYLLSAYFGDEVERHAYSSGYRTVGLTNFEPEIDDEGNPYYVGTTFDHKIGFAGGEATGVVVVNAITGEVKGYSLTNVPAWVDRIQPEEFIEEQMADRGEYINGWFNPSDEGRMRVDGTLDLVYGSNGRPYWVGGMAALGTNKGLSGFYFVDSRTKAVHYLKAPSVSQETAGHAVENVNPEKHYSATNPLPFLVNGIPTYVMALRDTQGVSRAFGMVDMRNNQVIGVADTLAATVRTYMSKRSANGSEAIIGVEAKNLTLHGKVVRIASEYRNNQTMYYVTIQVGEKILGNIFTGSSDLSEELVLTKKDDNVVITYSESSTRVVGMSKFHNVDIPGSEKPEM